MNESEPAFEMIKIVDEQAVEALRSGDRALFDRWIQQLESELDSIYEAAGSQGLANAQIDCAMRRAVVYYKSGHIDEAMSDLREVSDAAQSPIFDGSSVAERARALLGAMEKREALE